MADKLRVGVLGATGLVGQWFVRLLTHHPWFEPVFLAASGERAGARYGDVVEWSIGGEVPEEATEMVLGRPEAGDARRAGVEAVFSALPSSVAGGVEVEFARAGIPVFSNASPLRLEEDVPLVNGEVNADHLAPLVERQLERRGWRAPIVKNPNCTTAVLTLALKPLDDSYGLREVVAVSLQAASGAGLRGVPSLRLIDNLVPFIQGEEEKIVNESRKILGKLRGGRVEPHPARIAATATRVPVVDGHTIAVHVRLAKGFDEEGLAAALASFRGLPQELGLPTAPERPVVVRGERDRPQPRLDRMEGGGMSVVVGRVRATPSLDGDAAAFVVLGHNLVRGAAGAAVLAAELYYKLVEQVF